MLTEQIISPAEIESTLRKIWDSLGKNNKIRASLFNLVVYNKYSKRTNYFRDIVLKLIEKYPCRVIFITADSSKEKHYLKTAVSIISPDSPNNSIACDNIDIAVGGKDHAKIPFVILPHILPDLPTYLLWTENPCDEHPLLTFMKQFASRLIFDSESASDLNCFAEEILKNCSKRSQFGIGDLNWARTQQWRDLFASTFASPNRIKQLGQVHRITLIYNSLSSDYFCKEKIKSLYLQAWIASRLNWEYSSLQTNDNGHTLIQYKYKEQTIEVELIPKQIKPLATGVIDEIQIMTNDEFTFHFFRQKNTPEMIHVQKSSKTLCDVPYYQLFSKSQMGSSLINEIFFKGTSSHYLSMLKTLTQIKNLSSC